MAHPKILSLVVIAPALLGLWALGCVSKAASGDGTGGTGGSAGDGTGGAGGGATTYPSGSAGVAVCEAADARVTACGLMSTGYQSFYDPAASCTGGGQSVCMAACVVKASCDDLASYTPQDAIEGEGCANGSGVTGACVAACYGTQGCETPLVLSFDGAPVSFERNDHGFDFLNGMSTATDWPSAATPWLAIDRNGNGVIDDASELFGSASPLAAGGRATDGFMALRDLDSNGDGRITPEDEAWSRLLVWTDRNGDRVSTPDELAPLDRFGIVAIDLGYTRAPRCDARGNCEVERAGFRFRASANDEREGAIVDVHLRLRGE